MRTAAERILVEGGRAAGVEATYFDPEVGRTANVTVRAPIVVAACGALESPALLLRSGIWGPAVGDYLRLHPTTAMLGLFAEDQRAWWGAPHTGVVDEFANAEDGYGFLIETAQYTTGLGASAVPFTTAEEHKAQLADFRNGGTCVGLLRDRGHGRVTIDAEGQAVHTYALTDELDVRNSQRAIEAQIRVQVAAGAIQVACLAEGLPRWRKGDDLEAFIAMAQRIPLRAGGFRLFSAHQMGSCRMGADEQTSVANPWVSCSSPQGLATLVCSSAAGWAPTSRRALPTPGESCTTPPASGSATAAPSPRPRAPIR